MQKRIGPAAFIALGVLVVMVSFGYWQLSQALETPEAATLPETIAGLALTEDSYGPAAVDEVTQLHGQEFPLTSGAYGMYGDHNGMVMLWVAGAPAATMASQMVTEMEAAIAEGGSPFIPTGTQQLDDRILFELTGLGQLHYYFRSGSLVVWLAADETIAETALADTLSYYP